MSDLNRYLNPELIEKARLLTDWGQHEYQVDRKWISRCACGWTATEPYDVEGFDRHITETVLMTVADDIRADALREMGDWFQLASQLGTGERDDIAAQACYDRADRIGGAA